MVKTGIRGLIVVLVCACGPSFQSVHEADAQFEHCYALEENGVRARAFDVTVLNLSAGGAYIRAREQAWPPQTVVLRLQSEDGTIDINAHARVVRSGERAADGGSYLWALQFESLDMPTRSALSRFVFAQAKKLGQAAYLIVPGS